MTHTTCSPRQERLPVRNSSFLAKNSIHVPFTESKVQSSPNKISSLSKNNNHLLNNYQEQLVITLKLDVMVNHHVDTTIPNLVN
jgi:hypothetical protein